MKPEWCPQEVWEVADQLCDHIDDLSAYLITVEGVAKSLLEAEKRGRRMGMEEAAKVSRDNKQPGYTEFVDGYNTACGDISDTISAKMEEFRRAKADEALNSTRS